MAQVSRKYADVEEDSPRLQINCDWRITEENAKKSLTGTESRKTQCLLRLSTYMVDSGDAHRHG